MKLGSREILLSTIFMIPEGEDATFSHPLSEDDIFNCRIKVLHDDDEELKKTQSINVDFEDQIFTISFKNFNSPLGHSTSGPVVFGASNKGEDLSFLASIFKFKSFTKVEIQLMIGGASP
ncbi:MAG TPA: hypothetical protein VGH80_09195 [Xanthomonadaceae bacterium]|jgi:hypothetical protein